MDEKFIAYKGKKFTIEWYYNVKKESEALDYFEELTPDRQKKLAHLMHVMGEIGQIRNEEKFTSEDEQIYAFKPQPEISLFLFFGW